MIRLIHVFLEILRTMFFTLVTIIAKKAACKLECFFFACSKSRSTIHPSPKSHKKEEDKLVYGNCGKEPLQDFILLVLR